MAAARFLVIGRVQGVGFRFFAQRTAALRQVHGWVKNRSDGAVEVLAIGPEEALARLEADLSTGPPAARVERVHRIPVADEKSLRITGFRIVTEED